jgi:hypothetical protein
MKAECTSGLEWSQEARRGTVYYIGADYHKKYSCVVLKDREGKVERGEQHKERVPTVAEAFAVRVLTEPKWQVPPGY